MPKYAIKYRVVELYTYEVEASNEDEAVDMCWDTMPTYIDSVCAELEHIEEKNDE